MDDTARKQQSNNSTNLYIVFEQGDRFVIVSSSSSAVWIRCWLFGILNCDNKLNKINLSKWKYGVVGTFPNWCFLFSSLRGKINIDYCKNWARYTTMYMPTCISANFCRNLCTNSKVQCTAVHNTYLITFAKKRRHRTTEVQIQWEKYHLDTAWDNANKYTKFII